MRSGLLILMAIVAISIGLISVYLTPDDLADCKTVGTGPTKGQPVDAIVAVSGGNTSIRADEAIALFKAGWSDTIIFSGAAADESGPSNADAMRQQAITAGVPSEQIFVEERARTTKQNAEEVRQIIDETNPGVATRIILVTSPYHQRRASLEFRQLAGDTITIINRPASNDPDWAILWWATPRGWWLAGGELAKIIAFYAGETR